MFKRLPLWGTYALLAYMPFHIFLSQWLSTFTGGLDAWKAGKDVITGLVFAFSVALVAFYNKKIPRLYWLFVAFSAAYIGLHLLIFAVNRETSFQVALLATAYNGRLFWYLIIGMSAVLLLRKGPDLSGVLKLVLGVSTLVSLFAVVQYFLPSDFMTHFGYAVERGVKPNFFINEDPAFPRAMSTIRDPNSLGAYLIVPLTLLVGLIMKKRHDRRLLVVLFGLHLAALYLSFSRAAWGGTIVAFMVLAFLLYRQASLAILKRFWLLLVIVPIVFAAVGYTLRDNSLARSVIFRYDDTNAPSQLDSDALHLDLAIEGAENVAKRPLGSGPGTAGVVSIQNQWDTARLTENYYLQIAGEIGVAGLFAFVAAWGFVAKRLLDKSSFINNLLLASAAAYALMALIMHLWINEAVAAQWWLLAGVVLGISVRGRQKLPSGRSTGIL